MDIDRRISEIKEELKNLENEKKRLESLSEDKKLAEILHNKLCHSNHTDGCSWEYESWDKSTISSTRDYYLEKAKKLLQITNFETLKKIFKQL